MTHMQDSINAYFRQPRRQKARVQALRTWLSDKEPDDNPFSMRNLRNGEHDWGTTEPRRAGPQLAEEAEWDYE